MELKDILMWRYATKRMNGKKISEDSLNEILEAIRLAPTSYGLQLFKVFIVEDKELREKIYPIAYNQQPVLGSSHMLVFAAYESISEKQINEFVQLIADTRNKSVEELEAAKQMYMRTINSLNPDEIHNWNANQTYIALSFGMIAAAAVGVDSTPMEGFDKDAMDELLKLKEKGLRSQLLLALGYRDEETDRLAEVPKVRKSKEELFEVITKI
jgi:nitroreductase/dihydropteridine reductase